MAGLLRRFGNALSAGAHDALDGIETSEAAVRHLVRRATDDIARVRTLAIEAVAAEKRLGRDLERHRTAADDLRESAAAALSDGDEATARADVARRLEHLRLIESLEPQHATATENGAGLKSRLRELERSLERLRSRQQGLVARRKGAKALRRADETARELLSERDVTEQLSRAEAMVVDMETRNAAAAEIDEAVRPTDPSLAVNEAASIERELAALRASGG